MVPTEGLSIPNVPGGVFWDPEADAGFLAELRARLRPDIPDLDAPAAHQRHRVRAGGRRPLRRAACPGKERRHDRARPRQTALEQPRRSGVPGHPGVPEAVRPGHGADGEHRAARAAPAAVDRHRHRLRGGFARREDQQHAAHAGRLDRLLAAAHGGAGRGARHDHDSLVDAAGAALRHRPQPDPPRLQQDSLHQRAWLERQGHRPGAAQDPLRHRRAGRLLHARTWSATSG